MHAKSQISSMIHKHTSLVLVIVPIGTIFANACMRDCQRVKIFFEAVVFLVQFSPMHHAGVLANTVLSNLFLIWVVTSVSQVLASGFRLFHFFCALNCISNDRAT